MVARLILACAAWLSLVGLYTLTDDPSAPKAKQNVDATAAYTLISIITNTYGCIIIARSKWEVEDGSLMPTCAPIGLGGAAFTVGVMSWRDRFGRDEWEYVKGAPARVVEATARLRRDVSEGECAGRVGECVLERVKRRGQAVKVVGGDDRGL